MQDFSEMHMDPSYLQTTMFVHNKKIDDFIESKDIEQMP